MQHLSSGCLKFSIYFHLFSIARLYSLHKTLLHPNLWDSNSNLSDCCHKDLSKGKKNVWKRNAEVHIGMKIISKGFKTGNLTYIKRRMCPKKTKSVLLLNIFASKWSISRGVSLSRSGPVSHWVCLSECLRVTLFFTVLKFFIVDSIWWKIVTDSDK